MADRESCYKNRWKIKNKGQNKYKAKKCMWFIYFVDEIARLYKSKTLIETLLSLIQL